MSDFSLDWLSGFVAELPEVETPRENFFSIIGKDNDELINSNLLGFYLKPDGEHGFGSAFLDSLLECIEENMGESFPKDWFTQHDTIYVSREVLSLKGNYLDLLIEGKVEDASKGAYDNGIKWAILIENKVKPISETKGIHNDLDDYLRISSIKNTLGVLLNPNLSKNLHNEFHSILHYDLAQKVKEKIPEFFEQADDRHLLFLKEFLRNYEQYKPGHMENANTEKLIQLFHKHKDQLKTVRENDNILNEYIGKKLQEVMDKFGFTSSTDEKAKAMFFYPKDGNMYGVRKLDFRFWIWVDSLRHDNWLHGHFELHGDSTNYKESLIDNLRNQNVFNTSKGIKQGQRGRSTGNFVHIYDLGFSVDSYVCDTFEERLESALKDTIFNKEIGFLTKVQKCLNELKEQKQHG